MEKEKQQPLLEETLRRWVREAAASALVSKVEIERKSSKDNSNNNNNNNNKNLKREQVRTPERPKQGRMGSAECLKTGRTKMLEPLKRGRMELADLRYRLREPRTELFWIFQKIRLRRRQPLMQRGDGSPMGGQEEEEELVSSKDQDRRPDQQLGNQGWG